MSEQSVREFGERAVALVPLPDLEELERRGTRLRRRRQGIAAGLTAAVVAAVAWASVNVSQPKADQSPANQDDHASGATRFYGFASRPELDPGPYTWPVSHEPGRPDVVVDLPARWHAWDAGPNRWLEEDAPAGGTGYVGLIVTDVYDVVDEPCRAGSGMKELGNSPQELVDALASMPRHEVVAGPRADARFGSRTTYLRLRALHVGCGNGEDFLLSSHNGTDLTIPTAGQGARMDVWVVDAGTRPVLVMATWDPGSPRWLVDELHDVVDSIQLVEP